MSASGLVGRLDITGCQTAPAGRDHSRPRDAAVNALAAYTMGTPRSAKFGNGSDRGVAGLRQSRRGPCRLQRTPRWNAPFRQRGGRSALSALDRERWPPIETAHSRHETAQTLALLASRFTGCRDRGSDRNGLRDAQISDIDDARPDSLDPRSSSTFGHSHHLLNDALGRATRNLFELKSPS